LWNQARRHLHPFPFPFLGLLAERVKHLPAWIFHGGKDTVVPPENSEKIHAALKKAGSQAKMTIYPEAGHDSWTAAYDDPELWDWLMKQRRAAD
jgi:predicted peptidase